MRELPRIRDAHQADEELPATLEGGSVFNDMVSGSRAVGLVLLEASALTGIRRAVRGVTANDVASCIIAGGLREYLHRTRQLPNASLVAGMPINLRQGKAVRRGSNQIATMAVGLATQVADPVERLRAIHRCALAGKRRIKALGTGTIMDISDSVPPSVLAGGLRSLAWASSLAPLPVPFHTMISNVPGPQGDAQLGGLPLVASAGLGPVRDNMGLFHVISASAETVSLSFNACGRLLPDADMYARCILDSFRALHAAAVS
jgi:WS/DGAT/MGAT family acyltransferase